MTFIMTGDRTYPEWFTPSLKYLSMKKELLGQFPDEESWGEFGTERQIFAFSSLLDYFARTRNLADQFPQLLSEIILDNKNIVMKRVLHFPIKLYEQLLLAVVEGAEEQHYQSIWDQPNTVTLDTIEKFFVRRKRASLVLYDIWSEVHPIERFKLEEPANGD